MKTMEAKVSVVIPVYNVKKYLRECLDSLTNQTLQELEIICIDDGSTDGSSEILDEYAGRDKRFKVVHKENEGYGRAMNVGIDLVTSPYFGIVESDDKISPNMYEELYALMQEIQVDVIKSDYIEFYCNAKNDCIQKYRALMTDLRYIDLYEKVLNIREYEEALLFTKFTWTGLYSTDFIRRENIRHNETPGASYQDNGFWFQSFIKAKSIYFKKKAYYYYRIDNREASTYSKGKAFAVCDEYDYIRGILNGMGEAGKPFYKWAMRFQIMGCVFNLSRVSEEWRIPVAKRVRQELLAGFQKGEISEQLYLDQWKIDLFDLMTDPSKFVERSLSRNKKIHMLTDDYETIIIYGAGKIGQRIYSVLTTDRIQTKVEYFAVSDRRGNPENVVGVPVKEITELLLYKDTALIIVAASEKTVPVMKKNLKENGFCNYRDAADFIAL